MDTVAGFIVKRQAELGVSNRVLADAAGYHSQNVITMIRKGKTKLPLGKVDRFALALQVDPVWLLRLAMREYLPETLKVIEQCFGPLTTVNERCILEIWRSATNGSDPSLSDDLRNGVVHLLKLIKTLK